MRTILQVILTSILYVLMRINTRQLFHAHLLKKRNRSDDYLVPTYEIFQLSFFSLSVSRKQNRKQKAVKSKEKK